MLENLATHMLIQAVRQRRGDLQGFDVAGDGACETKFCLSGGLEDKACRPARRKKRKGRIDDRGKIRGLVERCEADALKRERSRVLVQLSGRRG